MLFNRPPFKQFVATQLVVIGLLAPLFIGCGGDSDGVDRVVLYGTVTYEGQPVVKGSIRLTPTQGPVAMTEIENGKYRFDYKGGVPISTHKVAIWSYDPNASFEGGPGSPQPKQYLPPKYNARTTLTLTTKSQDEGIEHNFDLTK